MLAVIKTGGKQYTVQEGTVLNVELLGVEDGSTYKFGEVLMISDKGNVKLGKPTISGATVEAEVLGGTRGDKILVFKKKRRKDYRKRMGHRQNYTTVKSTKIIG
jgi:large subunit ribosomal protein L21